MGDYEVKKILIVNWGSIGGNSEPLLISDSNLFVGASGSGKTTVVDAIAYLFYGITKFNSNADRNKGERSLIDYVRGNKPEHDVGSGEVVNLRTGETVSVIAAECKTPKGSVVVAVCLESPDDRRVSRYRMVLEDTLLEEVEFFKDNGDSISPYTHDKIIHKGKRIDPRCIESIENKGVRQILRAVGIKNDSDENFIKDLQNRIVQLLTITDTRNINDFIRNHVFKEAKIESLSEIKELKSKYEELQQNLSGLRTRKNALDEIEKLTVNYEKKSNELDVRQKAKEFQNVLVKKENVSEVELSIDKLTGELEREKIEYDKIHEEFIKASDELQRIKNNEDSSLINTLESKERSLKEKNKEKDDLKRGLEKVQNLENRFRGNISWIFEEYQFGDSDRIVLSDISGTKKGISEKQEAFVRFRKNAEICAERIRDDSAEIRRSEKEDSDKLKEISRKLTSLEKKIIPYPDRVIEEKDRLKELLREKTGKDIDVYVFAELIKSLTDESWRGAIESFLRWRRYDLFVEGGYHRLASNLLKGYDIHVVQVDKLPFREIEPNSAASILDIKHRGARMYANYLLNHLKLFDDHNSEEWFESSKTGGITRDYYVARGYTISKNKPVEDYCLGSEAVRLQIEYYKKEYKIYENRISKHKEQLRKNESKLKCLEMARLNDDYDFDIRNKYIRICDEIDELKADIERLRNNHSTYFEELDKAQKMFEKQDERNRNSSQRMGALKELLDGKKISLPEYKKEYEDAFREYEQNKKIRFNLYMMAEKKYEDMFNRNGRKSLRAISDEYINRAEIDKKNSLQNMIYAQQKYFRLEETMRDYQNMEFNYGEDAIRFFRDELKELTVGGKIEEAIDILEDKKREMQQSFLHSFIGEIYNNIERAQIERDEINDMLKRIPFGADIYSFEMKPKSNKRMYFNIIKKLNNDIEKRISAGAGDDEEFEEFMNLIIDEDDDSLYTDYRNYFDFDLNITRELEDGKRTTMSFDKAKSLSRGEMDCPTYIILAASLLRSFQANSNSLRLAFVDEAFASISTERIQQLVGYLKKNNFQVIYSAPDHRVSCIGPYVTCNIGFNKVGNYSKMIGGQYDEQIRGITA